jgi:hypothetical protein
MEPERTTTSRSLAIYGLLLELYPRAYLRQHRAEMLQNFADLELASRSKAALWLFIGKDLALSLRAHFTQTFWGQTAIVLIFLATLLAAAELHPGQRERSIWGFCCGYVSGWFAGWLGKCWRVRPHIPAHARSLPGKAVILSALLLVFVVARGYNSPQEHFVQALCYGAWLGWIAAWVGGRSLARL